MSWTAAQMERDHGPSVDDEVVCLLYGAADCMELGPERGIIARAKASIVLKAIARAIEEGGYDAAIRAPLPWTVKADKPWGKVARLLRGFWRGVCL